MKAPNRDTLCPVCKAAGFQPSRFGLLRCQSCGMLVNPSVWEPRANEAMEDAFFGETYVIPKTSAWVNWFEARNNRRTFNRIQGVNTKPGRMLEAGIGSGSWLGFMKMRGWEVLGLDLSKAICKAAESRWDVPTHWGGVETLPETPSYDLVVMNHVLEHVQEPMRLLIEVRRRMRPEGLLHLAVPNLACWEARLSSWNSYEPYHLLYFTPETLRAAVERAGFRVERIQTHESFSGWFLAGLRSLTGRSPKSGPQRHKERRRHLASHIEHVYRIAMITSGIVTWPIRRVQEALGQGDEVVALARA